LPPGTTSDIAASLIISRIPGLAVQAKAAASLETARRVARAAHCLARILTTPSSTHDHARRRLMSVARATWLPVASRASPYQLLSRSGVALIL
jgi:hypothetical protein